MDFIITPLRFVIDFIYGFANSYALAIILFTLLIKLVLLPLDLKQRSSMRRMQEMQPKLDAINKKYEKDPEKKSAKTMELYKKEKINPLGGCLPMLIQMPILFAMFAVMRHVADEQTVLMYQTIAAGGLWQPESFLWIHNIWQPDNIAATVIPLAQNIQALSVVNNNPLLSTEMITMVKTNYGIVMQPIIELYNVGVANGWAILPIVAGLSQFLTTKLMNGKQQTTQNSQQKMMNYIFPLMSVMFCWQYNAAFALYWVVSNLYTIAQYWLFNYFADKRAVKKAQDDAGSIKEV